MNGAEIDELISDVQTRKARAIELARRADWKRRELSARAFLADINHAGDTPLPHTAHDQVTRLREFRIVETGGYTQSRRSKKPPEMISSGASLFLARLRQLSDPFGSPA